MSAIVRYDVDGNTISTRSEPVERVRLSDIAEGDFDSLAEAVVKLSEQIASLADRLPPRAKEYEITWDTLTATDVVQLEHNFGTRVRWWVCNYEASAQLIVWETTNTDNNTLELSFDNSSNLVTLVCVRVEAAA